MTAVRKKKEIALDEEPPARVMISHANIEVELAKKIKSLLVESITGLAQADVWYAEDTGALDFTGDFFNQITKRIRECELVVAIQSPISKSRPWPLWECGSAFGQDKGPYIFTFSAKGSIRGRLGSPLDFQQQCDGTDPEKVAEIVEKINKALRSRLHTDHKQMAEEFVKSTSELVAQTREAEVEFDRRLLVVASTQDFQTILKDGTMPDSVDVLGDGRAFEAFGYARPNDEPSVKWGEFLRHLKEQKSPWPKSSIRWAHSLGRVLQKAGDKSLVQDAEALPLYYSSILQKSLRPALTRRAYRGTDIEFEITLVDLPAELVERPPGDLGILFHYLDLGRMLRWGVLESGDVLDLRISSSIAAEELERIIKTVLSKISNIRTEFFNRGLRRDALSQAVEEQDSPDIIDLMKSYSALITNLDPVDGMLRERMPDRAELLGYLDGMLQVNKGFLEIVAKNINNRIQKLPDHFSERSVVRKGMGDPSVSNEGSPRDSQISDS